MKIWIGTAGIPISSKGSSTIDGINRVNELGLNSLEVEFVRGVKMSLGMAKRCGEIAQKLGIRLSIHAPYFINLCSTEKEKIEASKRRILDSVERAHAMNADIVVFHPAYYGKLTEREAYRTVKVGCQDIVERAKDMGITDVRFGLETTGKTSQFGTIDEIIQICKEVRECDIVIDWAHLFARSAGRIDFSEVFDKISVLKTKHLHTHFSGIEFIPIGLTGKGNEKRHVTMDQNGPDYELLVKEILKRNIDITLISESPNLEEDAFKMKQMFEKCGYRF